MKYNKWITYTISETWHNHKVEEVLKGPLELSNRMINRLTRSNGLRLNGKMPWLNRIVKAGDRLQVAVRPKEKADLKPEPVPFHTIYEDTDFMIVDKPSGITVHPVRPEETGTLAHGILHHWMQQGWEGKVRPVHRLDRNTSGLLLIAKHAYAHQMMDRKLREKQVHRTYLAWVHGSLSATTSQVEGIIDAAIQRDPHHSLRRRVSPKGDQAITHYRILRQHEQASLVQVQLETGRTHQIRVHFSHLGHPLLGDKLYGGTPVHIYRQALHAAHLGFYHPLKGEKMAFQADLPQDLIELADRLDLPVPKLFPG